MYDATTGIFRQVYLDRYISIRHTGIYRNAYKEAIECVRHGQSNEIFKQGMKERKWRIAGLSREAKEQHGLRRAKYRGLEKMQIQAFLIGITQNLKRLSATLDFYFHWIRFWLTSTLSSRCSFRG